MAMSSNNFTNNTMALIVAIILICVVAVPIVTAAVKDMSTGTTKTIIEMLPMFMAIGVLVAAVKMYIGKKD